MRKMDVLSLFHPLYLTRRGLVFSDSPFAQCASKATEFQASHTLKRNLLHTKPCLNRTQRSASRGLRRPCNMTKQGKHHNDSCLFQRLPFKQRVPTICHCLSIHSASGSCLHYVLLVSWWQILQRGVVGGQVCSISHKFTLWTFVLCKPGSLLSGYRICQWKNKFDHCLCSRVLICVDVRSMQWERAADLGLHSAGIENDKGNELSAAKAFVVEDLEN